jgi:hypothetical protein
MVQKQADKNSSKNKGLKKLFLLFVFFSVFASAHPLPDTKVMFHMYPSGAAIDITAPLRDFEIVFNGKITPDQKKKIQEYFKDHIKISSENRFWNIELVDYKISRTQDSVVGLYDKIDFRITAKPQKKEDTRNFTLHYDAFVHQIYNHKSIIGLASDWEKGVQNSNQILGVAARDLDGNIQPLNISLEEGSFFTGFKSMVEMGFKHILEGKDHILFLISLLLVAPFFVEDRKWKLLHNKKSAVKRVVKIVTAFTVGHSLMLILGAIQLININPNNIEIGIAITILLSGINISKPIFFGKEVLIALLFGFVHGLAFANTITFFNLDISQFIWSVLGFNIGIELVQILIVLISFPIILYVSNRFKNIDFYRSAVSVFVIVMACYWMYERVESFLQ